MMSLMSTQDLKIHYMYKEITEINCLPLVLLKRVYQVSQIYSICYTYRHVSSYVFGGLFVLLRCILNGRSISYVIRPTLNQ